MYRFYEQTKKIREIQKYLSITESGNYDEKTKAAVMQVQQKYGISADAEINYDTFLSIFREYTKSEKAKKMSARFPDDTFPLKIGTYGEAIRKMNEMLLLLSSYYRISTNLKSGDYYGRRSEEIIREMSKIYGISRASGEISIDDFLLMEKDFNSVRRKSD